MWMWGLLQWFWPHPQKFYHLKHEDQSEFNTEGRSPWDSPATPWNLPSFDALSILIVVASKCVLRSHQKFTIVPLKKFFPGHGGACPQTLPPNFSVVHILSLLQIPPFDKKSCVMPNFRCRSTMPTTPVPMDTSIGPPPHRTDYLRTCSACIFVVLIVTLIMMMAAVWQPKIFGTIVNWLSLGWCTRS